MTTQNPEPETPATPQIPLVTGTYYAADDAVWTPAEVIALAPTLQTGETHKLMAVSVTGVRGLQDDLEQWRLMHGFYSVWGAFCAYPIKPGTFNGAVTIACKSTNDDGDEVLRAPTGINVDMVVTGEPIGHECDREALHHVHPSTQLGFDTIHANMLTILDGQSALGTKVHGLEQRLATLETQVADDGG